METRKELPNPFSKNQNLKTAARILLVVLLLSIVEPLIALYLTRYQLVSPLIPESVIWKINNRFIFIAMISAAAGIVVLILYFYKKYLWVIILVLLTLLSQQYVNV